MPITYQIAIDYDDDGIFSIGDTISDRVLRAEWRLGMPTPDSVVATPAEAIITVRNADRAFSPELSGELISKTLRIQSNDGTTIRTHFTGSIEQILPSVGTMTADQQPPQARIIARGRERELVQQVVSLPLQTNIRADTVIDTVLDSVPWRYAILDGRCIVGRDSIGSSEIFPTQAITRLLETGKSVFPYTAGDWTQDARAVDVIQRVTNTEGGAFFFNRAGEAMFYNRHHTLVDNTVLGTFSDDMTDLIYDYGTLRNELAITLYPRSVGAENTLLWSLAAPLKLERETTVLVRARYEIDDEPVNAVDVRSQAIVYAAYADEELQTRDRTAFVDVVVQAVNVDETVFEIRNTSKRTVYLTQLDLRGTPLLTGDALTVTGKDGISVALYGRKYRRYDMPLLDDVDEAANIIAYELAEWAQPRGVVRELHTDTRQHPQQVLARTLFDRITITESQTGHSSDYHIVAEQHTVDHGGTRHRVQWLLSPAPDQTFFVIGTHSIGDPVVLAPR